MDTFLKTFFICLVVVLSFLFYKFFGTDGYTKSLPVKNSEMYSVQKESNNQPISTQEVLEASKKTQVQVNKIKNETEKEFHTCYFYNSKGKLTPIIRETKGTNKLETSILILLKGPLVSESKQGIYSEIPPNTDLIDIRTTKKEVIINLTSNFANGGGSQSIENRLKQLSATVKAVEPNKAIYLYINGKEVEYLGGDGVYVKQPLS